MPRLVLAATAALGLAFTALAAPATAAAAKFKSCPLPAINEEVMPYAANAHRIRARGLPCYQAHWSIDDLLRRGLQHKQRFRFRSYGARWAHTWSCRSRWVEGSGSRMPAHHVSCTASRASMRFRVDP